MYSAVQSPQCVHFVSTHLNFEYIVINCAISVASGDLILEIVSCWYDADCFSFVGVSQDNQTGRKSRQACSNGFLLCEEEPFCCLHKYCIISDALHIVSMIGSMISVF